MGAALPNAIARLPRPHIAEAAQVWAGMLAVNVATAALLTIAARSTRVGDLAGTSAFLSFTFVLSVPAGALQLAVARAASVGEAIGGIPWRTVLWTCAALVGMSPFVVLLTGLDPQTVLVAVALVPTTAVVAHRRGGLLGAARLGALGASSAAEAGVRVAAGGFLGSAWGETGFALGVLLGALAAVGVTPPGTSPSGRPLRAVDLGPSTAALAGVAVLGNLDLLAAPALLDPSAADSYAAAAIPAKAIFVGLLALAAIAVPYARRLAGRSQLLALPATAVAAGIGLAVLLAGASPLATALLDGREAGPARLLVLGVANACAAGVAVGVNVAIARGHRAPWRAVVPSLAGFLLALLFVDRVDELVLAAFAALASALVLTAVALTRHHPVDAPAAGALS